MNKKTSHRSAHIYLLRLERVQRGTDITWLAVLQPVASGERRAFGSFDALTEFLKSECDELERGRNVLPRVEQNPARYGQLK